MRLLVLLGFFCACLFTATNATLRQPLELLVNCSSTSGLTTLRAARDKVRGLPRPLSQPVVVHVVGDCVALSAVDHNVLSLQGPLDSGDITWVAHRGAALHGGVSLPATGWTVVTEKEWYAVSSAAPLPSAPNATLLRINISALDLGPEGYGHFSNGGFSYCGQTRTELFVGERPMTIARFPNAPLEQGLPWMDWLNVGYTTGHFDDGVWCADSTEEKSPESPLTGTRRPCRSLSHREPHPNRDLGLPANSFTQQTALDPQRARRWSMTPVDRWRDAWLHGFWSYDWADNYIRVANVSVESETATFTYNASTQPAYGVSGGARFYVVNLAVELDAVGEYFIDDREGMLYFLVDPTVDPRVEPAFLSAMSAPLMVLHNVQNVSLVGWNVGYTRGSTAISVSGDETRNVRILNATGSNVGIAALSVDVGVGHPEGTVLIDGFTSVNAGCRAVALNGGDQTTLSESGVHFTRGQLSRYARWMRTYNPGVAFSGVGVSITLTDIGYAPHNGLLGSGNNHKFYNNTLHDLCYEVRDSGAFYIGRSWVNRGMVLRYNKFTRIQTLEPTALGANSVQAMYFDDQQSGVTADSNECLDSNACFLVGGGRDNIVTRNRCTNVSSSCILFDNRGMNWQLALCTNSTPPGMLVAQLEAVHYQSPPYSVEYPGLNTTMQDQPCVPVGNQFVNNTCCGCGAGVIDHGDATIASWGSVAAGNGHFCW